jgi:hypothetical protein
MTCGKPTTGHYVLCHQLRPDQVDLLVHGFFSAYIYDQAGRGKKRRNFKPVDL